MDNFIEKFFRNELYDEMHKGMVDFLSSPHIKEGKFAGNEILLNKQNLETVIVYKEYELNDGRYYYTQEAQIWHIPKLLDELAAYKKQLDRA